MDLAFTFDAHLRDHYLAATSYISSRAFPSRLLSLQTAANNGAGETKAVSDDESYPVLIPGLDLFNRESTNRSRSKANPMQTPAGLQSHGSLPPSPPTLARFLPSRLSPRTA